MSDGPSGNDFHNPYQTSDPSLASPPNMPLVKPTAATVFGILNLLFGVFGICGIGMAALMFIMPEVLQPPGAAPNPTLELLAESPAYRYFTLVSLVLGVFATIVMMIAGIGLLKGDGYGRTLSIYYGAYALAMAVLGIIVNTVFLYGPLLASVADLPDGPEKAGAMGGLVGGAIGQCCGPIYPIVLLIFMFRPNMVAYFSRAPETNWNSR